eukprot:432446-Rhodomonas_salina.1
MEITKEDIKNYQPKCQRWIVLLLAEGIITTTGSYYIHIAADHGADMMHRWGSLGKMCNEALENGHPEGRHRYRECGQGARPGKLKADVTKVTHYDWSADKMAELR